MTRAIMKSMKFYLFNAALLAAMSGSAFAVDGVVLIDQNKALAGNVTPGDTAGFPVTISAPGSYRLSSNLVVPDANTSAIALAPNTSGVTIDLNGFSIVGPTACSTFPCSPLGNGIGVSTDGTNRAVAVRNGTIIGMGSFGVALLGSASSIEGVSVINNGGGGILIGLGTVTGNRVISNGGHGIFGGNCVITQNNVTASQLNGINANDSIILNNALRKL